jgi:hypothetical protein
METKIARVISYLFHPLLVPSYVLVLLFNLNSFTFLSFPLAYKLTLAGMVLLTTFLFPLFFTWLLFRLQLIQSFFMAGREERIYPILAISVFYYITYYLLRGIHISTIFSYYILGATLLAILSLLINFYWKISLHMIGAGSFTGLFLGLSLNLGINFDVEVVSGFITGGIIGFARLKSDSHNPSEIYAGFLLGVVIMAMLMVLL